MRSSNGLMSRLLSLCAVIGLLLATAAYAPAQDARGQKGDAPQAKPDNPQAEPDKPQAEPDEPQAEPDEPQAEPDDAEVRRRFRRGLYDKRNGKDDVSVREAFRDVVAQAVQSTVAVISGGKQRALGAIVDSDGYLITKASELGEGELRCRLASGRTAEAKLVGIHKPTDMAMLKIDAENLVPIVWSDQDAPAVGSWLATTGTGSIPDAVGVVSVESRKIDQPGGMLGVVLANGDDGPVVDRVLPDSGAEKAGLHVNDTITSLNERRIRSVQSLVNRLGRMKAGQKVQLVILRGEKEVEIEATLTTRKSFQDELGSDLSERSGGFDAAIQHDTVLDANQCGGPVVDLDGKVVGINIARAGRVVSYALPAAIILPVLDELRGGKLGPAGADSRMAQLDQRLDVLRKSERELLSQADQLREALGRAVAALAGARKNSDAAEALKQAEAKAAEAEKAVKTVEARLTAARKEISKLVEEKTSLAGRSD